LKFFKTANNNFVELSKNLDASLKTILLDRQNNYVGNSNVMNNAAKSFDIQPA